MLRRRSQTSVDDTPVPADDPKPQGKGRPTPKRRDAEGRRRQPVSAPKDRKEAYRAARAKQAAERDRARKGMLAGDEKYFPVRDRGPARKFARDWVDSRRLPSQYFLPFSLLILLLTWIPWPAGQREVVLYWVMLTGWPIMMVGVLFTSVYVSWKVKKEAAAKFPNEPMKGVGFYAAMRALQIRKLRFPPPQLLPGGRPVPPKK
ncbi:DUF3043 domain-containing protein [Nonomuraea sp. NPDC050547]|uniref:DUF3043 domain-containing protein n=1 Tax=unclassified Nonomuraea TaxID=2593643 RepID=UPI0037A6970B